MRLTAFFKLYKICILLHRCDLKILAKQCKNRHREWKIGNSFIHSWKNVDDFRLKFWDMSGAKVSFRSRQELSKNRRRYSRERAPQSLEVGRRKFGLSPKILFKFQSPDWSFKRELRVMIRSSAGVNTTTLGIFVEQGLAVSSVPRKSWKRNEDERKRAALQNIRISLGWYWLVWTWRYSK